MSPASKYLLIVVITLTDLAVGAFLTRRLLLQGRTVPAIVLAGSVGIATLATAVALAIFL